MARLHNFALIHFYPHVDNVDFFRSCCSSVQRLTDDYDRYIVLSFTNATMVLEVSYLSAMLVDRCCFSPVACGVKAVCGCATGQGLHPAASPTAYGYMLCSEVSILDLP